MNLQLYREITFRQVQLDVIPLCLCLFVCDFHQPRDFMVVELERFQARIVFHERICNFAFDIASFGVIPTNRALLRLKESLCVLCIRSIRTPGDSNRRRSSSALPLMPFAN
jgi:hypothetical protein